VRASNGWLTWRSAFLVLATVMSVVAVTFGVNQNASARQWRDLEQSRGRHASVQVGDLRTRLGDAVRKQELAETSTRTLANEQAQTGDRTEEVRVLSARAGRLEPLLTGCISAAEADDGCWRAVQESRDLLVALQGIVDTP
jgi:hypothetical protein